MTPKSRPHPRKPRPRTNNLPKLRPRSSRRVRPPRMRLRAKRSPRLTLPALKYMTPNKAATVWGHEVFAALRMSLEESPVHETTLSTLHLLGFGSPRRSYRVVAASVLLRGHPRNGTESVDAVPLPGVPRRGHRHTDRLPADLRRG